jgi:two-component system, NtrC family, response regulator HydG
MSLKFKILVVDDNRSLIEALSDILEVKGYDVRAAFDGVQAIDLIRYSHFDCVLMDVRMPRMGGVDAFRQIRHLAPSTPIILMTGYSIDGLVQDAVADGVLALMQKPLEPEKLLSLIEGLRASWPVVIAAGDPDASISEAIRKKGYRLAATTKPGMAVSMAVRDQLDVVLLQAEVSGVASSDVAFLDPLDAKCVVILLSDQPVENTNNIVPAALSKPFKIHALMSVLENVRVRLTE